MSKKHAQYSPSAAERWVNCPASIRLSIGIPNIESEAARSGTNEHSLLERMLLDEPLDKKFKEEISFNDDMLYKVSRAYTCVKGILSMEPINHDNVTFEVEVKSDLSHIVDADFWGTSDVSIAEEFGRLHVIDYKGGKKAVKAENNYQGAAYVLGIADKYDYNFSGYKFSIIQPENKKLIDSWSFDFETLMNYKKIFRSAIASSKKQNAPLHEGSWCWFCPASKTCPLKMETRLNEAMNYFE